MKNHFNIKKLTIFTFIFMCFFAISNKVEAKTVTCNYRIDQGTDGAIDVILSYDNDSSKSKMYPKVTYKITEGIKVNSASADFQNSEIGSGNGGCPSKLYSTYGSNSSTSGYYIKFYLSEGAASKGTYDIGTLSTYSFASATNYADKKSCTLYGDGEVKMKKVVIYYDPNGGTPEITYEGEFSKDGSKIQAQFTSLKNCPNKLYMTIEPGDGYGEVKKFFLNPPSSGTYYTFNGNIEIKKKSDDSSNSNNDSCTKLGGTKKYITLFINLLRFAIPVLIIVFSTFEFLGVVLSGDDEKMEKAKKHFIIRLVIGVIILLVPFFIGFALRLIGVDGSFSDIVCNII